MTTDNLLENQVLDDTIPSLIETNNNSTNTTSLLSHVASAPVISNPIDLPTTNDSDIKESNSLGTSPNIEKKKTNRCCWETCKKKLGLTGMRNVFFKNKFY